MFKGLCCDLMSVCIQPRPCTRAALKGADKLPKAQIAVDARPAEVQDCIAMPCDRHDGVVAYESSAFLRTGPAANRLRL